MSRFFQYDPRLYARRSDPATSHIAAQSINIPAAMQRVYQGLLKHGDMDSMRLAARIYGPNKRDTVSPRMPDLVRAGLVIEVGRTGDEPPRTIWRAVEAGAVVKPFRVRSPAVVYRAALERIVERCGPGDVVIKCMALRALEQGRKGKT
jgi:hypothetical protein